MKVSKIAAAIALMGVATPIAAQAGEAAKPVGHVASTNGGVFISRDGKLVPASAGQELFKGDRVVTRADSQAQVALAGCSYKMAATSIMSVNGCTAPKTLTPSQAGYAGGNATTVAGSTWLVALLALTATITGVVVATNKNSSTPTSP